MIAVARVARAIGGLLLSSVLVGALCSGTCYYAFSSHNHHDKDHTGSEPMRTDGGGHGAIAEFERQDLLIARFTIVLGQTRSLVGIEGVGVPESIRADDFHVAAFGKAVIRANEALLGVREEDRLVPRRLRRHASGFELGFGVERQGQISCTLLLRFDRCGALRSVLDVTDSIGS